MSPTTSKTVQKLQEDLATLRHENEELLSELENAYAQLTAIIQVSQDETRIAYSELQEKVVVLEKKLFERELVAQTGEALLGVADLDRLQPRIVEKVCLLLPVDLAALHLVCALDRRVVREHDVVSERTLRGKELERVHRVVQILEEGNHRTLRVGDLHRDPRGEALRLRLDARSAAAVPLRSHHFLGFLLLNSRLASNFREDQEPLLDGFGRLAAWSLEHALRLRTLEDVMVRLMSARGLTPRDLRTPGKPLGDAEAHSLRQAVRSFINRG